MKFYYDAKLTVSGLGSVIIAISRRLLSPYFMYPNVSKIIEMNLALSPVEWVKLLVRRLAAGLDKFTPFQAFRCQSCVSGAPSIAGSVENKW